MAANEVSIPLTAGAAIAEVQRLRKELEETLAVARQIGQAFQAGGGSP